MRSPKPKVVGWWDYVFTDDEGARIVVVDMEGAGRLGCATVPGDQLKHLRCPLDGPCTHDDSARWRPEGSGA